jgi:hypothetical protein
MKNWIKSLRKFIGLRNTKRELIEVRDITITSSNPWLDIATKQIIRMSLYKKVDVDTGETVKLYSRGSNKRCNWNVDVYEKTGELLMK